MRKSVLLAAIIFSGIFIQAQTCKDVIYPTKGKSVIFDCCIEEVKDGNMVRFTKNDTTSFIEAISIIKAGLTLQLTTLGNEPYGNSLYKGHNYKHYAEKYEEANKRKIAGIIVSAIGLSEVLAGLIFLDNSHGPAPQMLIFGGTIAFSVGIPIALSGGIEASNNKKAMKKIKNNASLSFGTTNHGIGLVLNF